MTRKIELILDEQDWETIQEYMASEQAGWAKMDAASGKSYQGAALAGDSNLAGSLMAECVRNLDEYRILADLHYRKGQSE